MRWLAGCGLLALAALAVAGAALVWRWRAPLPVLAGQAVVAGLSAPVRIARDAQGVPHVDAASEGDAFLATGFVHAQDRLFQMDLLRRAASGRLAEILGPVAVEWDRRARRSGHAGRAAAGLAAARSGTRELLAAYTAGVNAAAQTSVLPPEYALLRVPFEPWTPEDSLLVITVMQERLVESSRELTRYRLAEKVGARGASFLLDGRLAGDAVVLDGETGGPPAPSRDEARREAAATRQRLLAEAAALGLPLESPVGVDGLPAAAAAGGDRALEPPHPALAWLAEPAAAGLGSNAWVVAGPVSESGSPLLANDTHLGLETPSPFYLVDLAWPGTHVAGATVPGFPGVVIGRNERVAWGVTILTADGIDHVIERLVPGNPQRYQADGVEEGLPFTVRTETIQVKGAPPVVIEIRSTRHGPVMDDDWRPGEVLVQALPPAAPVDELEAVRGFATAAGFDDFRTAAASHGRPFENLLYADVDGHIGYVAAGAMPLRGGRTGLLPAAGWQLQSIFTGVDAAADRPFGLDPTSRRLVSANNRVLHGSRGEAWNGAWIQAHRAARAADLLDALPRHNAGSFRQMQQDTLSRQAALALEGLRRLAAAGEGFPPGGGPAARAWTLLAGWDARFDAGPSPGLFSLFWERLKAGVFADDVGDDLAAAADAGLLKLLAPERHVEVEGAGERDWADRAGTQERETLPGRVASALGEAWAEMVRRAGEDAEAWDWPRLHQARFVHPLGRQAGLAPLFNGPALPVAGTGGVLLATACIPSRSFDVVALPAMRMIADLAPGGGLRMVIPIGQSGLPASPHYDDQARPWAALEDFPIFLDEAGRAALESRTLQLEPSP